MLQKELIFVLQREPSTIHHRAFRRSLQRTHYTGPFRVCAALWGTFIIFFMSKYFWGNRCSVKTHGN